MSAETLAAKLDALWLDLSDDRDIPVERARIMNALDDAAQALRTPPAGMEAVAWRVRRKKEDAGFGRPQVFTTDDASEGDLKQWRTNGYDIQPLYTHLPQPDALPGDLRERVRRLIKDWPFHTEEQDRAEELADAILSLIQSERGGG